MSRRTAVIGSGVSGLIAAHVLSRSTHVTLYEADDRAGGHAHTHDVALADGTVVRVDSGFIVHNDRTYPTLGRLFAELGVATQPTDMSMSVFSPTDQWQYAGGQGLRGIFADPRTSSRPAFLRMLLEVRRFHQQARSFLAGADPELPLRDWLGARSFSDSFHRYFMTPLVAAVWSCDDDDALDYPARSLFTFLEHHGMLSVKGSPAWRTVVGGSRAYVDQVVAGLADVRLATPVIDVARRAAGGVRVSDASGGTDDFDAVVIASHPQQALAMLREPTDTQRQVLGAIEYSVNQAVLHRDPSVLPTAPAARAAWNYRLDGEAGVLVTYDLTRLMRLPAPAGERILVTLNGSDRIDKATVIAEMTYEHPLYDSSAVAAQSSLAACSDDTIAFAGAYHGWGFHEDGALSGLRAAERIGGAW
ncbi:NAD(P)/FAD-dependent oxidoreductase [Branchiibius hedensis]|uniref:NAD(P)/FAD-dependent oxidoreductase n=1 Tax=Branchiibius hedensis TaxID=672460 RepID=UPI000D6AB429|nr:FAD-dependent oxidoreductase [Branchiibius hedensis]